MKTQQMFDPIEPEAELDPCDSSQAEEPDIETLMAWEFEGICEAVDGCVVELCTNVT